MPLFKEWNPGLHSLAAVWHITEPESFFAAQVPLEANHIAHEKRRIEYLAGRFLLQYLDRDFPIHAILPDDQDKPQVPGSDHHFSISHSYPYVACVISSRNTVGIDIQCWHKSILALQHKFLSASEQTYCGNDPHRITAAWCGKEAAYKYQGRRGVDFIRHLPITKWVENGRSINIEIKLHFLDGAPTLSLNSFIFNEFSLCVTNCQQFKK